MIRTTNLGYVRRRFGFRYTYHVHLAILVSLPAFTIIRWYDRVTFVDRRSAMLCMDFPLKAVHVDVHVRSLRQAYNVADTTVTVRVLTVVYYVPIVRSRA